MQKELAAAIQAAVQELFNAETEVELTRPEEQFGDYATNVALQLAPKVNKPPREIAEDLIKKLKVNENLIKSVADITIAGPGFINFSLNDAALWQAAKQNPNKNLNNQKIVAEYSDPNPFKVLHAGHLYTSVVGDAIANLLEQAGGEVHRVNYGGDVGLHVAKSLWGIIKSLGGELPEKLNEIKPEERPDWLSARYVEGNEAYENGEAKDEIVELNKRIYKLFSYNDHDSPFAKIYWTCRQWSYDYFNEFYGWLGTKFEKYYPESEVAPLGLQTVKEHIGAIYRESDGAIIFDGEKYDLHARVFINSAGLPTYEAKEVGLILKKWEDYHYDLSVYITGNDITEYMKVVFKSIEQFQPDLVRRSRHLTHGIVKLQGGSKMSSRKGNVLRAVDVLNTATDAARQITEQVKPEVVLAAVKYAFLKNRIGGDIIYDPAESVSLEGNSGPYLQYAHARARSILVKAAGSGEAGGDLQPAERSLLRKISEYPEVVDQAVAELLPHHICTYLYELAQNFNRFYENNRVIGDERQAVWQNLITHYAETLKKGLNLLGIAAPDKM